MDVSKKRNPFDNEELRLKKSQVGKKKHGN